MGSLIKNRNSLQSNFEQYIVLNKDSNSTLSQPKLIYRFPASSPSTNEDEIVKDNAMFAFPLKNNLSAGNIEHFTFVRRDEELKWLFGYCRQHCDINDGTSQQCFIFLSYIPYAEKFFYRALDICFNISSSTVTQDAQLILDHLYHCSSTTTDMQLIPTTVPNDRSSSLSLDSKTLFSQLEFPRPHNAILTMTLHNRCLSDFYNFFTPKSMIRIFASLLAERRILITSNKLCRFGSIAMACNAILFPFNWQHLFIPILPDSLGAYLEATMPFLIGAHISTFEEWKATTSSPVDVVHVNADSDTVVTPFPEDLKFLPSGIVSMLRRRLVKNGDGGDDLSRSFLKVFIKLLSEYERGFTKMDKFDFDTTRFIRHSKKSRQKYLKNVFVKSQMFQQFVQERSPIGIDLTRGNIYSNSLEPDIFQIALEAKKIQKRRRRKEISSYCAPRAGMSHFETFIPEDQESLIGSDITDSESSEQKPLLQRHHLPLRRPISADPRSNWRWSNVTTELESKFRSRSNENIGPVHSQQNLKKLNKEDLEKLFPLQSHQSNDMTVMSGAELESSSSLPSDSFICESLQPLNDADADLVKRYGLEQYFICDNNNATK